jgi:hypothetical protein
MMTHGKDTPKDLQEAGVQTGGGGTTTVGRARRGYIRRRRSVVTDRKLGKSRAKRLMCNILVQHLMSHHLNHAHDEGSESTRSERVDGDVPNLINYVVKDIKVLILHDGVKKIPLISWYGVRIANPQCQSPPPHPMENWKVRKKSIYLRNMEAIVWDIHRAHLPSSHHASHVKLLGVVEVRGQPKNLSKLWKLDWKSSSMGHHLNILSFLSK